MASGTRREIAVGALALAGVLIFFFGTLLLKGGDLGSGQSWTVIFVNVNGLKRGSPVQISGFSVGHVTDIKLARVPDRTKLFYSHFEEFHAIYLFDLCSELLFVL